MTRRHRRQDPLDGACERLLAAPPSGRGLWRKCIELWVFVRGLERLLESSRGAVVTLSSKRIAVSLAREAPRCYEAVLSGRAGYVRRAVAYYVMRISKENGKYVVGHFNHKWTLTVEGARRVLEIARAELQRTCQ